jgi:hypothetical protein
MSRLSAGVLSLLLGLTCTGAWAQWAWKDAKGTTVYSDQPPPPDIKPSQVIRQPGAWLNTDPAPAKPAATPNAKTPAQMEAEFRQRQSDKAEAQQKAAEKERAEKNKAEQCARVRTNLQVLQDGMRVRSTTTGGVMDDTERASEIERLQRSLSESCK